VPLRKPAQYSVGGVDSRSNPTNYPSDRLLRCKNFVPLQSGQLRLRYGYTAPTMGTVSAVAIHSAAYYELYAGTKYVIYGQSTSLKQVAIGSGTVTTVGTLSNANPWGHFRSANRIFFGNGTDMKNWDGTTLRSTGIRVPTTAEAAGVTASATNGTTGSFATTLTSLATPGYQMYMSYYNPTTGHVGNRIAIGSRVIFSTTGYSLVLTGLPDISGVNSEWVKLIGRTNDGGSVPYAFVDSSGNRVVVAGNATVGTITDPTIDTTQELPTRNGVPLALNKFAKVGSKIFGARDGDINIYYTEDDTDITNGNFVGVPAESWAGDNLEPFPTAEVPTAVHGYQFEGWFFSQNYLAIWSLFQFQQGQNPWRGVWDAGCAGQRAFIITPYGPHWVTRDKQLMGWNGSGPIPVSEEYEAGELGKIGDAYIANIELAYYRNPELGIDRITIKAQDVNGNPLIIYHDFKLRDFRSQIAQAYETVYSGMTPNTLVGSGYSPRQNVRDTNGREKLWCGATDGHFYQLDDGTSDNGSTYTGDAIFLFNAGDGKPLLSAIEWQGDGNAQVSWSTKNSLGMANFTPGNTVAVEVDNPENRWQVDVDEECHWVYARVQLTSHPADGDFTLTDPPFVPIPTYGILNAVIPKFGRTRDEAP